MNLLKKLWRDEAGVFLSAEAAVVGTVAVLGVSAGAQRCGNCRQRRIEGRWLRDPQP